MTKDPVLSAIVISQNDEDRIERAVRSVWTQEVPEPFEVIVVVSGHDRTADIVRERFPEVRVVELPRPALPGEARNAGLRVARGQYISFPGSHVELPQGSLAARVRAHRLGYDMVTGAILNGTDTPAGWASYFLDHSYHMPGRPSAVLSDPPTSCSYTREALVEVGGFPEGVRTGEDTVVNTALFRGGRRAFRAADVRLIHNSPCRDLRRLLVQHFGRGRGLGRILLDERGRADALPPRGDILRRYVAWRVGITDRNLERWGDAGERERYRRVRRLIKLAAVAAWAGVWTELVLHAPTAFAVLRGRGSSDRR